MNKTIFNIEEIIKAIPHRYPLLLVDKIIEFTPNQSATGIKNVTFNEPHFTGHFPEKPIMPGVLIIEAMAQVAGVMAIKSDPAIKPEDTLIYFMSIDEVKFRKPVVPGDVLELKISLIQNRSSVWKMAGVANVEGIKVAEAKFSAMIINKNKQSNQS
jgi:3-hydroxyacyl-[acyl-carrier-protein] dehydratase